jgi:CDP-2,3-bis-(O-geranylgeranyl)-sn-glycerol synthase
MLMGTLLATLPPLEIAPLLRSLYPTPPMGALTGGVLGFGALAGDMAKSFFKRRLKREEGSPFFPWDSLDYVIGMLVFGLFLHVPSWQECLVILAAGPLFSLLSNVTAYSLGLKDVWY